MQDCAGSTAIRRGGISGANVKARWIAQTISIYRKRPKRARSFCTRRLVAKVAGFAEPVLLIGEAAPARNISPASSIPAAPRPRPFVPVNCAVFSGASQADSVFGETGLMQKVRGVFYAEPGGVIDITHVCSVIETAPQVVRRVQRDGPIDRPKTIAEVHDQRTLEDMKIEAVRTALIEADWNVSAAARKLRLTRAKRDYRMKKFHLMPGS